MNERTQIVLLLGGTVLLAVLLFFAPRTPGKASGDSERTALQDSIQRAVRMVNKKGTPPMKGIRILKALEKEHPEHPGIQWHLGRFSIRSGQYEKAAERFEKVVSIAPRTYQDAYLYLGKTYATLGDTSKAIERLKSYRERVKVDSLREQVDGLLRSLRK